MSYLFTSQRLGFRTWKETDLDTMVAINQDPEVMRFFPNCPNRQQTLEFLQKMQIIQEEKGYCYFATEKLDTQELIGFIGFCHQTYEAAFTPCTDIGWRLAHKFWGKGYATEGAKRCLEYATNILHLSEILSVAPMVNQPSIHVMEKIGMKYLYHFKHPYLKHSPHLEECVLYGFYS